MFIRITSIPYLGFTHLGLRYTKTLKKNISKTKILILNLIYFPKSFFGIITLHKEFFFFFFYHQNCGYCIFC